MELRKKIAQSICVEVRMPELDSEEKIENLKRNIQENQWGSIIIFEGEIHSSSKLISELQELVDIPLFVCSDLERGAGQHFKGATDIPSNMAIAATNNLDLAYKAAKITAQEAKDIGVNVIFSPSVDINNNPDNPIINIRSFGENPQKVADFGQAFIKGAVAENVLTTPKHFPGHGDTSEDSHVKTPVIKKSKSELNKMELFPFRQVLEETDGIMTAHIIVPALDKSKVPATISKEIIVGLLRNTYNFQGLIFTDALMMGGIIDEKSFELMAYTAGCDILLMPRDPIKTLDEIVEAVNSGEITEERVNESCDRVLKFKNKYIDKTFKPNLKRVKSEKNTNLAKLIAEDAITKVIAKNKLPLNKEKTIHILIDQDDEDNIWQTLKDGLNEKSIETILINSKTVKDDLEGMNEKIKDKETVILSFFSHIKAWKTNLYPEKFVIEWLETNLLKNKNTIVVAYSNPYFIKKVCGIKDYYCTFSDSTYSQEAVIKVLFENAKAKGISPISL